MGSVKSSGTKQRLVKAGKRTRWPPFWIVPKIFGLARARHTHPSALGQKRHWRRSTHIKP